MKKTVPGACCAMFVVGAVFAEPIAGKKEEPKAGSSAQERTSPMPVGGKKRGTEGLTRLAAVD